MERSKGRRRPVSRRNKGPVSGQDSRINQQPPSTRNEGSVSGQNIADTQHITQHYYGYHPAVSESLPAKPEQGPARNEGSDDGQQPPSPPSGSRGRISKRYALTAASIIIIILVIFAIGNSLSPLLPGHRWACHNKVICADLEQDGELIGISDGAYAFDTQRENKEAKQQKNWVKAVEINENDAEALIYRDNPSANAPNVVTIVAVTMLTVNPKLANSVSLNAGRPILQGIYTAQREINTNCLLRTAPCWQVRILIANVGEASQYSDDIADQIQEEKISDPTFAGVIGFPFSFPEAIHAVKTLEDHQIPIVSPSASSDHRDLQHNPQYFFRVNPDDMAQAQTAARFAQTFNPRGVVIFEDPCVPYSQTLATAFRDSLPLQIALRGEVYQSYADSSDCSKNYPKIQNLNVQSLLDFNADLWYFSGYTTDLRNLLSNPLLISRHITHKPIIMGGDALYVLGNLGDQYNEIYFTAFAFPDEWDILKRSQDQIPPFFDEFKQDFNPYGRHNGDYDYVRPQASAMLAYDASRALFMAVSQALSKSSNISVNDIQKALLSLNFQGITGQIHFDHNTGNAVDKAVVIACVDASGHTQMLGYDYKFFSGNSEQVPIDSLAKNRCQRKSS